MRRGHHSPPADGAWVVRPVTGQAAVKAYRCPGCDHEVPPGMPHVVAWRDDRVDERRHWHTACWRRSPAGRRAATGDTSEPGRG